MNAQSSGPSAGDQAVNALKLVADVAIIPGSGQLVEGKVGEGAMFGLAGVAAKVLSPLLGPMGWILWVGVGLDSYSMSTSGRHLWQQPSPQAPVSTEANGVRP
jgi:hypothetical protein